MSRPSDLPIRSNLFAILATLPVAVAAETRDAAAGLERPTRDKTLGTPVEVRPKRLAPGTGPARANDPQDLPCPADLIAVIYDEDANGNRVPGSEVYFCVWD